MSIFKLTCFQKQSVILNIWIWIKQLNRGVSMRIRIRNSVFFFNKCHLLYFGALSTIVGQPHFLCQQLGLIRLSEVDHALHINHCKVLNT
jgi:hypothetical protein